MKDRVPTYPGRVKLTPVPGSSDLFDMERADEPIETGTPLNKATLLTDYTANMLDIPPETATPDKAFRALSEGISCGVLTTSFVGDNNSNTVRVFETPGKPVACFISQKGTKNISYRTYSGLPNCFYSVSSSTGENSVVWGSNTITIKNISFTLNYTFDVVILYDRKAISQNLSLTVLDDTGAGIPNCTVYGLYTSDGSDAVTNSSGVATGSCFANSKLTIKNPYVDVLDSEYTVIKDVTSATVTLNRKSSGVIEILSTKNVLFRFSHNANLYLVGGGQGGGGFASTISGNSGKRGGKGGDGGKIFISNNITLSATQYTATIGAGGAGGAGNPGPTNGSNGGDTLFGSWSSSGGSPSTNVPSAITTITKHTYGGGGGGGGGGGDYYGGNAYAGGAGGAGGGGTGSSGLEYDGGAGGNGSRSGGGGGGGGASSGHSAGAPGTSPAGQVGGYGSAGSYGGHGGYGGNGGYGGGGGGSGGLGSTNIIDISRSGSQGGTGGSGAVIIQLLS